MTELVYSILMNGHAPFEGLGQPFISSPRRKGDTFFITFGSADPEPDFRLWDSLVGHSVRVVRRTRDNRAEACGGILESIDPIRVHVQGTGWKPGQSDSW